MPRQNFLAYRVVFSLLIASYCEIFFWSWFSPALSLSYAPRLALLVGLSLAAFKALKFDLPDQPAEIKLSPIPSLAPLGAVAALVALINVVLYPYFPIFHVHSFGVLDGARWISKTGELPWLPLAQMAPSSVFVTTYPAHLLLSLWGSFFPSLLGDLPQAAMLLNIVTILLFILSAYSAYSILLETGAARNATWGFFFLMMSLPPFFEVFLKYPGGDLFVFPFIFWVLAFSAIVRKTGRGLSHLMAVVGLAIALRIYLLPVLGVLVLASLFWNRLRQGLTLLRQPQSMAWIFAGGLLAASWSAIYYFHYGALWNDFGAILFPKTRLEILARSFRRATNLSQVLEGTAWKETLKGLTANSIYYKTYAVPHLLNGVAESINALLSTPLYFLCVGALGIISLKRRKKLSDLDYALFALAGGVCLTVAVLNRSHFPMIKVVAMAAVAYVWVLTIRFERNAKNLARLTTLCASILALSLAWQHVIVPSVEVHAAGSDFKRKYGNKAEFAHELQRLGVTPKNSLWIVRAEHGGFLPLLLDGHLWDYLWYDSPTLEDLHSAKDISELRQVLQRRGIRFVVGMNEQETSRFFGNPFGTQLGYPEVLLQEIRKPNRLLKTVAIEKPSRGLELTAFELN